MHRMNPIAVVAHFCFELITPTIPGVFIICPPGPDAPTRLSWWNDRELAKGAG